MPLIKKCSHCKAKGFFLKISDGLCQDCCDKIIDLECTYTAILKSLSTDTKNRKKYLTKLISIINDINDFKDFSSVLDYDLALNIINENIMGVESNSNNDTKTNSNNSPKIETLTLPTISLSNKPIDKPMITVIKNEITNEISEKITKEPSIPETIEKNEKTNAVATITVTSSDIKSSSISDETSLTVESIEDTLTTTINSSPSPSDKILIDEIYKNVSELIDNCNTKQCSLNELGKTFFLMKDNYLPMLTKYNVKEVNGTDVENFVSALESKLTLLTSQPKEELYNFFNYVSISIQTSGNNKSFDYILEISASKINFGEIVDEFYTLINPVRTINTNVIKRTGIDNSMVSTAPTIDVALLNLYDFIDNYQLISYNSTHTIGFLALKYKSVLNIDLPNKEVCILRLYRIRYRDYHGLAPKLFDMFNICSDLLTPDEVEELDSINSIAESSTLAIYKLYETLKYKYK